MADGERRAVQTKPEFELFEKSVNAAIFKAEREITDPEERAALDDFTKSVRTNVDARRELVELNSSLIEQTNLREQGVDVDSANRRYDEAVDKHGAEDVEAAASLLQNLNTSHDAWVEAGEPDNLDHPTASIYYQLAAVVDAAREGNSYLAELVETNEALKDAAAQMDSVDRDDERTVDAADKDGDSDTKSALAPADTVEHQAPEQHNVNDEVQDDRETNENTRQLHEQQMRVGAANKTAEKGDTKQEKPRDQQSSDPARQQVPRQSEQQRERDDDFER